VTESSLFDTRLHAELGSESGILRVLEVGGSGGAVDSFEALRGREPGIDALRRHQGMARYPCERAARHWGHE